MEYRIGSSSQSYFDCIDKIEVFEVKVETITAFSWLI